MRLLHTRMIIRSKALLDRIPGQTETRSRRCYYTLTYTTPTGYQKIFEAVGLAASAMAEGKTIDLTTEAKSLLGAPIVRIDAMEKATGTARYAADIAVDGCAISRF